MSSPHVKANKKKVAKGVQQQSRYKAYDDMFFHDDRFLVGLLVWLMKDMWNEREEKSEREKRREERRRQQVPFCDELSQVSDVTDSGDHLFHTFIGQAIFF